MNIDSERKAAIEKAIASEQTRRSLDEIYAIGLAYLIRGDKPILKDVYGEEVRAILREHGMMLASMRYERADKEISE